MVRFISILCIILVCFVDATAQSGFATVHLQRKYTFEQQPLQVTIKVYSSTWFTQGVEFGDLTVKDAFIIPFTNSVAGNETVNGKNFAVVSHYFLLFPYKVGKFTFPSLLMTAYIPPKGDYIGKATTIKTKEQYFTVRALPELKENIRPFLASRVYISDYWNKDFTKLKVGDVVERTVKITAVKTIANFIPSVTIDSVTYAKRYLNSNLTDQKIDNKKETLISTRTEKFSYLFAKAGDFEMPGSSVTYFDPYRGEYRTVKSKSSKIHVDTTSNLGIVASIADSLQSLQLTVDKEVKPKIPLKEKIITFFVQNKYFIVVALLIIFLFKKTIKFIKRGMKWYRSKRNKYLASEQYAFTLVKKQSAKKDNLTYLSVVYQWLLHPKINEVSITQKSKQINDQNTFNTFTSFLKTLFGKGEKEGLKLYQKQLEIFRKKLFSKSKNKNYLEDW